MSNKKYMWGCWVTWKNYWGEPEWMWDSNGRYKNKERYFPLVFTDRQKEIMPLVRHMRQVRCVKSAKAVRVPMPEGP